jgi:glycosyltransferase involved in cell wall biosynthesis
MRAEAHELKKQTWNGQSKLAPPGPPGPTAAHGTLRDVSAEISTQLPNTVPFELICLSHLRWDFVYQRPQHLMSRCARQRRVFFFEEPLFEDVVSPELRTVERQGVTVAVPVLPRNPAADEHEPLVAELLREMIAEHSIRHYVLWFYTPMALGYSRDLSPLAVVYDCMDELSMFKGAPPELRHREAELFRRADHIFTGGESLYEGKRPHHASVHAFPSSIDKAHFATARNPRITEPEDQTAIPHPRLGFFGVLDERLDRDLLRDIASARPEWQFCIIGPVVKIDPAELPQAANIHYLGGKRYEELPRYLAGWDVALLLFARNDSTRFISPTKTPEYLAAAKPVVSTPITDVIRPYGELGLVSIADEPSSFVAACDEALRPRDPQWLAKVDAFLAGNSWDQTWSRMNALVEAVVARRATERREEAETNLVAAD